MDRRQFALAGASLALAGCSDAGVAKNENSAQGGGDGTPIPSAPTPIIAMEEAFVTEKVAKEWKKFIGKGSTLPEAFLLEQTSNPDNEFGRDLRDVEGERLRRMDECGLTMQVLSLTAPGVQLFDADTGTALAAEANDYLADCIKRHPTRFAGLASFAPQDPARAAKEMERAITQLKLNGFIVNSHTNGEYLDAEKYRPILEAAEALGRPLYIHPRCPPESIAGPFREYGMLSSLCGFPLEVTLHCTRLIQSGVLDRFPKLKICIGHMGEYLISHMYLSNHWSDFRKAQGAKAPVAGFEETIERNFLITTSAVAHTPALDYCLETIGAENILFAIDYPYVREMDRMVGWIENAKISDEDRRKICYGNAVREFHIKV